MRVVFLRQFKHRRKIQFCNIHFSSNFCQPRLASPSCSREPCVLLQACRQQHLLLLLGLQKDLTTALNASRAKKKAAWLFIFQQLICYAWLNQNRGASLLEEAPVAVQGQCQMLRGILCGGSPRGGLCPGHQLAAAQDGWLWRSVKLHEGKRCSRGPSFLGRVGHRGEDSFSLLPTVGCPPSPGVPGPPSPFLPEHLAALQGSASASLLCPANRDGSADRLPATAEINPRNMARGPSVSKGNLDRCPISSGFCCILCLPRCRLGGPCGALCPSAPAH